MRRNKKNDSTNPKSIVERIKSFLRIKGIHRKDLLLMLYDMLAVTLAFSIALWFRFDCQFMEIDERFRQAWSNFAPIYAVVSVIIFALFHLYHSIWKFASFAELERIVWASGVSGVIHAVGITVFFTRMPISYYLIGTTLQFVFIAAARFAYRFISLERIKNAKSLQDVPKSRVMLIGAGNAGQMILRDLQTAQNVKDHICCIIDDDSDKQGRYLYGVPIVGGREDILFNVEKYKIEKIYLAIPGATAEERRDILDICKETDCQLKSLPGIAEIVSGEIRASQMRDVSVEDLLGRASVKVNMDQIYRFIIDKVVLVTGGGGSIGSELCRQIAKHNPKLLIVFDIYENNAHAIG